MFRQLLKYDIKYIFKYWWIAAATSIALSFIGGYALQILEIELKKYEWLHTLCYFVLFFVIIGICIFPLVNIVLVLIRYYKNFFSDEAYLTFTLPVKKHQLINSKIATGFILTFITNFTILMDLFIFFAIGLPQYIFDAKFIDNITKFISEACVYLGGYLVIYIFEFIILSVILSLSEIIILYTCITIGSMLTKKHKMVSSIAIYYGVSFISSFVVQILVLDSGIGKIFEKFEKLSEVEILNSISIIVLMIIAILTIFMSVFYLIEYYLIDKKLNLE